MSQTAVPSRADRHQQRQSQLPDPRSFFQRPQRPGRPQRRPHQAPRHTPLWRRVLKYWWAWLLPMVGLGLGGVFGLIYVFGQVPVPQDVLEVQATVVVDANDNTIGTLASQENRRIVPLSEISGHMRNAVLAAEDHQFYEHGAVSYRGILRAAWANLTNGSVTQGGSTLTQQYVKIAYLTQERTLLRKANEAILAIKLEQQYSKDRILEDYLNLIYFGRGAYGVEAAAQAYFGRGTHADTLNPQQAAFLAGIIRNPNFYAEVENAEAGKERRNTVLAAMGELGMLPGPASEFQQQNLDLKQRPSIGVASSKAPHFMEKVRLNLIDLLGAERVNRGGLRVITTLDLALQEQARVAVEETIEGGEDAPRVGLAAIDPTTGAVVAMYGGRDFATRQFNYATDAPRQAGSTMKPFVLATALEQGMSLQSRFDGSRCVGGLDQDEERKLCNFGNADYGMISLLQATIKSANTPFLRLIDRIGPEEVAKLAESCGFGSVLTQTGERPANLPAVPSLALGAGEVSTLQLTSGFAALANRGVHLDPYVVAQVQEADGSELYRHRETPDNRQRCMDENVADTVNFTLQQAVEVGTGHDARVSVDAAGKTGTTNNNIDARFAGYTPQLAASVWLGYDDASRELVDIQGVGRVTGGSLPAGIWHDFMAAAIDSGKVENVPFQKPDLDRGEIINPLPEPPKPEVDENGEPVDGEDGEDEDGQDDGDQDGQDDGQDQDGDGGDQDGNGDGGQDGEGDDQGQDGGDGGDGGGDPQAADGEEQDGGGEGG